MSNVFSKLVAVFVVSIFTVSSYALASNESQQKAFSLSKTEKQKYLTENYKVPDIAFFSIYSKYHFSTSLEKRHFEDKLRISGVSGEAKKALDKFGPTKDVTHLIDNYYLEMTLDDIKRNAKVTDEICENLLSVLANEEKKLTNNELFKYLLVDCVNLKSYSMLIKNKLKNVKDLTSLKEDVDFIILLEQFVTCALKAYLGVDEIEKNSAFISGAYSRKFADIMFPYINTIGVLMTDITINVVDKDQLITEEQAILSSFYQNANGVKAAREYVKEK